jgi:hypothetical protein
MGEATNPSREATRRIAHRPRWKRRPKFIKHYETIMSTMAQFPRVHALVAAVVLGALAGCGGGTSQSAITNPVPSQSKPVSTGSPSPVPTISALYPSCAPAGEQLVDGVDTNLSVFGPNAFAAGSVVRWNGSDRPTTASGAVNSVNAQIAASDIAAPGTAVVTVFNPGPGGGSSNFPDLHHNARSRGSAGNRCGPHRKVRLCSE